MDDMIVQFMTEKNDENKHFYDLLEYFNAQMRDVQHAVSNDATMSKTADDTKKKKKEEEEA